MVANGLSSNIVVITGKRETYDRFFGLAELSGAVPPGLLLPSVDSEAWGPRRSLIMFVSTDKVSSNCESVMVIPSMKEDEVLGESRRRDGRDELLRIKVLLCAMRRQKRG
jgi:hypothetical protein